jgi:hypothetical protein
MAGGAIVPHYQTIRCINKGWSQRPHERILYVGGVNPDGSRWRQSQQKTIAEIESGSWAYFCQVTWRRDRVIVATYLGAKYLKCVDDPLQPETLLWLPECPEASG